MAIRFDSGEVLNPHLTEDGVLLCDAVFARDGVLEYKTRNGTKRREFRPPEENQKAIAEFGLASITLEHPSGLVDRSNGDRLRKGISLQSPKYVTVPGKGGFVTGQIAVMAQDAQDAIRRGDAAELSAGYKCRIEETPGEWLNPATGHTERYDAVQRDIKVNHIALTKLGRAGPSVKVLGRFDAADLDLNDLAYQVDAPEPPNSIFYDSHEDSMTTNGYMPNMATLNLPGGSVTVPQEIFNAVSPLLSRNDSETADLRSELAAAEERADSAEASLEDVQGQIDYKDGMIEALRDRLDQAESLLEDSGIVWHRDSYRTDGGKKKSKKPAFLEEIEDEEEDYSEDMDDMNDMDMEDDMDDEEEEMPFPPKGKKKAKKDMKGKKDSVRADAISLLKAIREAEALGIDLSELHLDSIESDADIRRYVVSQLMPQVNLDSRSDEFVDGLYAAIADNEPNRYQADSGDIPRYDDELSLVLGQVGTGGSGLQQAMQADQQRRMGNYRSDLTATKGAYGKRR